MAYIRGSHSVSFSTTSHPIDDMPPHDVGTLLVWVCAFSTTTRIGVDASWLAHPNYTPVTLNTTRFFINYKIASSNEELPPSFTTSGTAYSFNCVYAIEDYDPANIWGVVGSVANAAATTASTPSLASAEGELLVIDMSTFYNAGTSIRPVFNPSDSQIIKSAGGREASSTGYRVLWQPGTIQPIVCRNYLPAGAVVANHSLTFTVRNKVGGSMPAYASYAYQPLIDTDAPLYTAANPDISAANSWFSIQANIGSFPPENRVNGFTLTMPGDTRYLCNAHSFGGTISSGGYWLGGGYKFITPRDFRSKIFRYNMELGDRARTGNPEAYICVLYSSLGNWAAFQARNYTGSATNIVITEFLDETSAMKWSAGTLDWSAITEVHFFYRRTSTTNTTFKIFGISLIDKTTPVTIVGGGPNRPISASTIAEVINAQNGGETSTIGGAGQVVIRAPIKLGNGVTPTYVDTRGQSIELPRRRLPASRIWDWDLGNDKAGIEVQASPTDKMYFGQGIFATGDSKSYFTLTPPLTAGATYGFENQQFKYSDVEWASCIPANDLLFAGCDEVDAKCATFNRCNFVNQNEWTAATCLSGSKLLDCDFTAATSGSGYAIRMTTAGPYDLTNTSFTDYYKDIFVDVASGDLTVKLSLGQDIPTYDTSGATITWDQPVVAAHFMLTGMISGSRYAVRNTTTDALIVNDIADTTGEYDLTYDDGTSFTGGDQYRVIVTKYDGASAWLEKIYTGIVSSAGAQILVEQSADSVYSINGVVGEDMTGIVYNGTDIDIDLDGSEDPDVLWKDIYAKYVYVISTETGIETFTGLVEAIDAANYRFSSEIVFNNIDVIPVRIGGDGYGKRADGIVMFGTGNLQIDNSVGALAVEVGTSGLTPEESSKLSNINTQSNIIPKIKKETGLIPAVL